MNDYVETRISETLELEVIQRKRLLLPRFSLVPHLNLLSGCKKEPSVFATLAAGGVPSVQHHLSPRLGWVSSWCTLALLHWF